MYARVSTYRGSPEQLDVGIRHIRENILPRIRKSDGYKGGYFLVDRQSGKSVAATLWESEQAMRASEEAADRLRSEGAEASGATEEDVDRYEVAIADQG